MVGFNRRFAPLVERLQAELGEVGDLVLAMRVNAGPLPDDHWLHDPEAGGGRLVGEGCHFVDLLSYLAGSPGISGHAVAVPQPGRPIECSDSFTAHIRFRNAVGTLVYSGGGDSRLPKERLELFGGGAAAVLDDFRLLSISRGGKRREWKSSHDKGHQLRSDGSLRPRPATPNRRWLSRTSSPRVSPWRLRSRFKRAVWSGSAIRESAFLTLTSDLAHQCRAGDGRVVDRDDRGRRPRPFE